VIATDASAEQIKHARTHPLVEYRVAPAEESGLEARSVQLVTVAQALHWFDVDPFMREVRRALKPGGLFAAWCYSRCTVDPTVDELVNLFYTDTVGPFWPAERRLVDEGYRTIALPLHELAPPPLEMLELWSLPEFTSYVRTWSAVNRFIAKRGEEPVFAFEEALAERWGDPGQRRGVKWPLHVRIGTIR